MRDYREFRMENITDKERNDRSAMELYVTKRYTEGASEKGKDEKKNSKHNLSRGIIYIIVGVGLLVIAWFLASIMGKPSSNEIEVPSFDIPVQQYDPSGQGKGIQLPPKPKTLNSDEIFNKKIEPVILECHRKNEKVLEQCLVTLDERIKELYSGIDPFLDDITSLLTKMGMVGNWVFGDSEEYIKAKFEKHVVSEEKLKEILNEVVEQYIMGISGNINYMYTQIEENMEPIAREFNIPQSKINRFVESTITSVSKEIKEDSYRVLWNTIVSLTLSEIGGVIAVKGTAMILEPFTARIVSSVSKTVLVPVLATVSAEIGATLSAFGIGGASGLGTAGATIGSIVPGVGTLIGLGVELLVGSIIEYFIDEDFKAEMKPKLANYLKEMSVQVKNGLNSNLSEQERIYTDYLVRNMRKQIASICEERNREIMTEYQRQVDELLSRYKNQSVYESNI